MDKMTRAELVTLSDSGRKVSDEAEILLDQCRLKEVWHIFEEQSEDRTPQWMQRKRIFFSLRTVLHSCFTSPVSSNGLALAQCLMNQVSLV